MNKLLKNISLYSIVSILPPVLSFILLPVYVKHTTVFDFGIITSMQVFNSILLVFFLLALHLALYRVYHDYNSDKDKKDLLGTVFITIISFSTFFSSLLFIFRDYVNLLFISIDFSPYYIITISYTFFNLFSVIPLIYYQINHKAKIYVLLSLLSTFISLFFILYFVVYSSEGAFGFLKGEFLGKLLMLPIYVVLTFKIINFRFSYQMFLNTINFSLPMIPGIMAAWVLNLSDRIFIERYFSLDEVAIYSLGYKIASIVLIAFSAINTAYNPFFYEKASSSSQVVAKKELSFINNLYVIFAFYCSMGLVCFTNNILNLFFDERYSTAITVIPMIVFACFLGLVSGLLNLMFNQEKKSLQIMYIIVLGAIINVLLNVFLVPLHGMYGAAISTLISCLFILLVNYHYSKRYYFIPFSFRLLLNSLILYLLVLPIMIFDDGSFYFIFLKLFAFLIVGFLIKKLIFSNYVDFKLGK